MEKATLRFPLKKQQHNNDFLNIDQEAFEWSCENGEDNLTEFLTTHSKTLDIEVNRQCTFRKTKAGEKKLRQVWYNCNTCKMLGDEGICHACAKVCHGDHDVTYADYDTSFFCKCGANQDGSCISLALPQNELENKDEEDQAKQKSALLKIEKDKTS